MSTIEEVRKHGRGSTSFLTLYPGFQRGAAHPIAYIETPRAWVGGSEPFCAENEKAKAFADYAAAAAASGKTALLLPASEADAAIAERAGFGKLLIGSEPWHDLTAMADPRAELLRLFPTAQRLHSRGCRVTALDPAKLGAHEKAEIDVLIHRWLGTRKMDPLGFLNRVEPWILSEHKRYFRCDYAGRLVGFLAAVPVWGRNSWYFVDLIRDPAAPAGATELLVADAMGRLKREGYAGVTLGFSPLARIRRGTLAWAFEYGSQGYGFKSLYRYKNKFRPMRWENSYLLYSPPNLGSRAVLGLSEAVLPGGIGQAIRSVLKRGLGKFRLRAFLESGLSHDVAVRKFPKSVREAIHRSSLSILLLAMVWLYFIDFNEANGLLPHDVALRRAYTWQSFSEGNWVSRPLTAWFLPAFFHWDLSHILVNTVMLFISLPLVEILGGARLLAISFFVPAALSNPLTSLFLLPFVPQSVLETDLGASLGIFGVLGALFHFFDRLKLLEVLLLVAVSTYSIAFHQPLELNHVVAFVLGRLCARIYVPKVSCSLDRGRFGIGVRPAGKSLGG